NLEVVADHLDFASRHPRVLGTARPSLHLAADADHRLEPQPRGKRFGVADHDLHRAPPVAQVDEDDGAVVAPACDPAVQVDLVPFVRRAKRTAVRRCETAQASRVGSWAQSSCSCAPLDMSRTRAVRRDASSGVRRTTHLAPNRFANRILAVRLLGSKSTATERTLLHIRATSAASRGSSPSGSTTTSAAGRGGIAVASICSGTRSMPPANPTPGVEGQ